MSKDKLLKKWPQLLAISILSLVLLTGSYLQNPKIDNLATDGLLGVEGSLAYKVDIIQNHLHTWERWFEVAAVPVGETHVADKIGDNGGIAFQIDAGNDDWGSYVQVIGSEDTPCCPENVKFDVGRIFISDTERTQVYFVQVLFGETGAAALAAGTYTSFPFQKPGVTTTALPLTINTERNGTGTKVWIRAKCPGQNTATIDMYVGVHGYRG